MATGALAPYVTRTSAAMALTSQNKSVLVFYEEGLQLHARCHCLEIIENVNLILRSLK